MSVFRVPIVLTWPGAGSPGVNVYSIRTETFTGDDAANLQEAVDALHSLYSARIAMLAGGCSVTLGEVTNREDQTRMSPTFLEVKNSASTGAAPPALQVVCSWRTSLAARRGMGRTFFGPLDYAVVQNNGTIEEANLTALRGSLDTLLSASTSGTNGWALGVWGLQSKAPKGTTDYAALPHVHRDVIGYKVRDQFSVLRSRRD